MDRIYLYIYGGLVALQHRPPEIGYSQGCSIFQMARTFKEITPKHYVEGPMMFRKDGKYYFMWSEGGLDRSPIIQ